MSGIYYDQDSTNAFYNAPLGKMDVGYLDLVVDRVSGSQLKKYFMCPGGACSIAKLKSWETYTEGFELSKGPEQPAMRGLQGEWPYRFAHNLHSMLALGVDPVDHIVRRAKHNGMEAWITMRMNDIHCGEEPESPFHSDFWRRHPEFRISAVPYENSLDYSFPEVREHYLARAFEVIEKYPIDGFQADWTRFPTFFPHGQGPGKAPLINDMMRAIKRKTDQSGKKTRLGVRVPGTIDICLRKGLDVISWCREGLVDYVVIAPFLITTNYDMPVEEWRNAINNPDIDIVYGLETSVCAFPGAPRSMMTPEEIRGAAAAALHRGADAIYLFNFFQQILPSYPRIFEEIGDLDTLKGKPRTVRVTWNDDEMTIGEQDKMNRFPGWVEKWRQEKIAAGQYKFPLPAPLSKGAPTVFDVYLGPLPEANQTCVAEITLAGKAEGVSLAVNGNPAIRGRGLSFAVSREALREGRNVFSISTDSNAADEIVDLRISAQC